MRYTYPIVTIMIIFLLACKSSEEKKLQYAHELAVSGRCKDAVLEYTKLINQRRLLQPAYYYRGNCYLELGQYAAALMDFNRVVSFYQHGEVTIIPNYNNPLHKPGKDEVSVLKAFFKRGQVYYYMDSLQQSYADFQTCINEKFGEASSCYLWQGNIFLKRAEAKKACWSFQYALQAATKKAEQLQANQLIQTHCN